MSMKMLVLRMHRFTASSFFTSCFFFILFSLSFGSSSAFSAVAGDVAPQAAPDNVLNNNDILIIQQFIDGTLVPTATEKKLSDVYPLGAPNGIIDINDIDLLNQAIAGQVTIPAITLAPPPTLNALGFTSTVNNPIAVSGTATANAIVEIYSNGVFQASVTAAANGTFTINTPLVDGANSLYAISISGANVSSYSSALTVSYSNTISRVQSGSISGNTVWTPGVPAQPYSITGADLVVPVGSSLVIQPGAELQFASGRKISVDGTLIVRGSYTNKAKLVSANATPAKGAWAGITINNTATNVLIEHAIVESATKAIYANGASVKIKNNSIGYFSQDGIHVQGAGANGSVIQANTIDNLTDTANCININNSSPSLIGNALTNCSAGIYMLGNSSPSVNGNNIITSNIQGIQSVNAALTALPVITGNQIFANSSFSYSATSYAAGAQNLVLNATGNWWGTTDATAISSTINDLADAPTSTVRPSVNYGNFLNAADGTPVAGNYLIGPFTATTTTLTAGTTYDILGALLVPAGKTVNVLAGTQLKFHGPAQIVVNGGSLKIQGTSTDKVTLTSGRATPARNDWKGILIKSGTGSIVEHAVIEYASQAIYIDGVVASIKNNSIRYFNNDGIYVQGAGASGSVIQENTIDNLDDTGNCVYVNNASPSLIGNTLTNCSAGIYMLGNSSPTVNGNNIITSNVYGLQSVNAALTALPVITGNQIFANSSFNYSATSYAAGAQNLVLNATGNWWGATDATAISNTIADLADAPTSTVRPSVNYGNFLNAAGGTPVPGNYLIGAFTATTTTLTAGTTYDILGALLVPAGKTVNVPAGTQLKFHGPAQIVVNGGSLKIQGTSTDKVTLTSGRVTPARNDWKGILITSGTGSIVEHAVIEYASQAIYIDGVVASIKNNSIRHFNNDGIYVQGTGANGSVIEANTIDNLDDTGNCVYIINASPSLIGNTLTNCSAGVYMQSNSSPTVNGNNIITGNVQGIQSVNATLTALPVITGNQIFSNSSFNYNAASYAGGAQNLVLNATGNWWGTTDASAISSNINDLADAPTSTTRASVNYGNFLNAAGGTPVAGNYLIGAFTSTTTTLTAGATYEILGALLVPAGKTVNVPAGTQLKFHGPAQLLVNGGSLKIQGTSTNKVTLTSGRVTPARNDWKGILITSGTGSIVEHAVIEYASQAIYIDGVVASIKNNSIRHFNNDGIYVQGTGANGSVIEANTIDNLDDTGNCVYIINASPSLIGNTLTNCSAGVYMQSNSSPTVNGNNIITSNIYGLQSFNATLTALPVITGNQIFSNSSFNYNAASYVAGAQNLVLNATGNWWGTTDASAISNTIADLADAPTSTTRPSVNFSNFLNAAGGTPVAGNHLVGPLPASLTIATDSIYEVLGLTVVPAGTTLTVSAGAVLRFTPGSKLVIDGSLIVLGTATNPAVFTSAKATPSASDWHGILINPGATNVSIQNAVIQYADRGIDIDRTASVVNVMDSLVQFCNRGIYINGNTKPVINNSRIVSNTDYGVYIVGTNNNATDPKPVFNNNDIYNHSAVNKNIFVTSYTAAPTVKIDLTNNWWGTPTPTFSQPAMLNTTPVLTGPGLAPIVQTNSLVNFYFSPNADTIQDTSTLASALSETADWIMDIKNGGTLVRSYSGSGLTINSAWDGKNASAVTQADGRYSVVLKATAGTRTGIVLVREVELDNTVPHAAFDPMLSALIQRNVIVIPVIGSATDENFLNYTLDYSNNLVPVTWNPLAINIPAALNASLHNWVVGSSLGEPVLLNGQYTLRLVVKDLAGNQTLVTAPVTIDNLSINSVAVTSSVNFASNTSASINFTLNMPGTVTIKIFDVGLGSDSTPIRTFNITGVAGANTTSWDGKDQLGNNVPGSAYLFVIEASDGTRMGRYDTSSVVYPLPATFQQVNATCDAYRNIFASTTVTTPQPGLAGLQLNTSNGFVYPFGEGGTPVLAGTTTLYWDCRDPLTGALVSLPATSLAAFTTFPVNTILVDTVYQPAKVKGVGANIEVKSDPYLVYLSYGQFTKIAYNLELIGVTSAQVDIKLLPPLVLNFDDPSAISIFSGIRPAGDHEVTWEGLLGGPENASRSIGGAEGAYTFAIKTTVNGVTSLYRGTLSVYQ